MGRRAKSASELLEKDAAIQNRHDSRDKLPEKKESIWTGWTVPIRLQEPWRSLNIGVNRTPAINLDYGENP